MQTILSRRSMLGAGVAAAAALSAPRVFAQAAAPAAPTGPFALPKRAYEAAALEPHIDTMTMDIHYTRHHGAFITALNAVAKDHGVVAQMKIEDMLGRLGELPEGIRTAVRNAGGGHANHTMFWEIMGPNAGGAPTAKWPTPSRATSAASTSSRRTSSCGPARLRLGLGLRDRPTRTASSPSPPGRARTTRAWTSRWC